MSRQNGPRTRYQELAGVLADEVRRHYRPGDLLPAETRLASRFAVNRHTVRRAMDELVNLGMISRHPGRGTQVVDQRLSYAVQATSQVSSNLAQLGLASRTACLDQGLQPAPAEIAACFGHGEGTPLLKVDTLRSSDDEPLILLRHWFDPARVPDWTRHYQGGSTRALLESRYGLVLRRQRVRILACEAGPDEAYRLRCPRGAALLQLLSENVDAAGRLVEVSIGRARGDRLTYHFEFPEVQP
ncbi:phosphonate metabolism transcriptional regulator PhnF [Pseudomonas schmalbachii]|uniref:Phosphonate metabolism transcriptional regulator PhnF n=1 Tax=Pseudomonas schmalbachii TaxID=2816993 RepID=A0ABS3TQ67_9PSED|nr:phosphonate metabolism transcriptional regulator PhnF [Pseudomonas schmalbachii]MBO3275809.1 phosphonate metabolism transcriptional regulator PhnF [Pseudomonas schmalbachii]